MRYPSHQKGPNLDPGGRKGTQSAPKEANKSPKGTPKDPKGTERRAPRPPETLRTAAPENRAAVQRVLGHKMTSKRPQKHLTSVESVGKMIIMRESVNTFHIVKWAPLATA
jgi:hypothetical protein